jgi:rhodanese-related sulfurtransferase
MPPGDDAGPVAAALLPPWAPAIALAETPWRAQQMAGSLLRAGFRRVLAGVGGSDAEELLAAGSLHRPGAVQVDQLAAELATGDLPLGALCAAAHLLPSVPIVTACATGVRTAAGASALRRPGHRNVWRLAGGGIQDLIGRPLGLDLLGAA